MSEQTQSTEMVNVIDTDGPIGAVRRFIYNIGREIEHGHIILHVNHGYVYFTLATTFDPVIKLAIIGSHFFLAVNNIPIIDMSPVEVAYLHKQLSAAMDKWAEGIKDAPNGILKDKIKEIEQWYQREITISHKE